MSKPPRSARLRLASDTTSSQLMPWAAARALAHWMPWLEQRGEHLIASHHPLRETLISQLGPDPAHRHQTLARRHPAATEMIPPWTPPSARSVVDADAIRRRDATVTSNVLPGPGIRVEPIQVMGSRT